MKKIGIGIGLFNVLAGTVALLAGCNVLLCAIAIMLGMFIIIVECVIEP